MIKSVINGDVRNEVGSNACNRIRREGNVPGVVYGDRAATKIIEVDKREINNIVRNYGTNIIVDLYTGGNLATVMIKDIQRHPVTNEVIHIDFQEVSYNKAIHATVPIRLLGKEKVESKEGIIQQQLREIEIECLPNDIPESIDIDISFMKPGNPLKVADVEFGQELSVLNDSFEIIATLTRTERFTEDTVQEEELFEKVTEMPNKIEKSR
ncbi:50S ribosomal protein L25 [Clostridiaceae bacterium 35-E11]